MRDSTRRTRLIHDEDDFGFENGSAELASELREYGSDDEDELNPSERASMTIVMPPRALPPPAAPAFLATPAPLPMKAALIVPDDLPADLPPAPSPVTIKTVAKKKPAVVPPAAPSPVTAKKAVPSKKETVPVPLPAKKTAGKGVSAAKAVAPLKKASETPAKKVAAKPVSAPGATKEKAKAGSAKKKK
ncbi:MAG TPA: hypothetical protein VFQ91_07815 [Bryobacteraceae bacterium]|nr:hypothetical protein [Bryobacteraceae bacterium]